MNDRDFAAELVVLEHRASHGGIRDWWSNDLLHLARDAIEALERERAQGKHLRYEPDGNDE